MGKARTFLPHGDRVWFGPDIVKKVFQTITEWQPEGAKRQGAIAMKILAFIKRVPAIVENFVVVGCSLSLMTLVAYSVFARYLFSRGMPWLQEVNGILYIWLCFFALSWAMRGDQRGIMSIDTVPDALKEKGRLRLSIAKNIVSVVFYGLIIYSAWDVTAMAIESNDVTPYWKLPASILSFGLMLGISFTAVRTAERVRAEFKKLRQIQ